MLRTFTRAAAVTAVLFLTACGGGDPPGTEPAAKKEAVIEAGKTEAAAQPVSAGPPSAKLAYLVAENSPLLSEQQRIAISQDFNGAPLSGPPAVHEVAARQVTCNKVPARAGDKVVCAIAYSETSAVEVSKPEEAVALYDALGMAGVVDTPAGAGAMRAITALACTVDDAVAQSTPSSGDNVAGFACKFTIED